MPAPCVFYSVTPLGKDNKGRLFARWLRFVKGFCWCASIGGAGGDGKLKLTRDLEGPNEVSGNVYRALVALLEGFFEEAITLTVRVKRAGNGVKL